MEKTNRPNCIVINDTRFIYQRNLAGDLSKSGKFPSNSRVANIVIPTADLAQRMVDEGYDVKMTKPREGEEEGFVPQYFVKIEVKYRDKFGNPLKYLPKVYLVTDGEEPTLLDEDSIGILDNIRVKNVQLTINPYVKEDGGLKAYVRVMYVEQNIDDDPFAEMYRGR